MDIYVSIIKTPLDIFKCGVFYYRAANPVSLVVFPCAMLVQPKREKIRLWGIVGDIAKNRLDLAAKW